jgi:shikimate 5-dehydrogenase
MNGACDSSDVTRSVSSAKGLVRIVRTDIDKRIIDLELSQDQTGADVIIDITPTGAAAKYNRSVKRRSGES